MPDPDPSITLPSMEAVLPLDQMTTEAKLRAMKVLWADLTRKADSFESPAWHGDVLRERDQRVSASTSTGASHQLPT